MLRLIPAAAPTSVGPYAVAMAVGFVVGVFGHVIKSRLLILCGIVIVGVVSAYVAFGVAKVG
jgi:CHASE2 domain-containing sensor protein